MCIYDATLPAALQESRGLCAHVLLPKYSLHQQTITTTMPCLP